MKPPLGRAIAESTVRSGQQQLFTRSYDDAGRLNVLTYPEARRAGDAEGTGKALRVQYKYNDSNGSLLSVHDADDAAQVYWQALARDEQGHVTREKFGPKATTSRTWNMQRGWMTGVSTQLGNETPLQNARYDYTAAGLMKGRHDDSAAGGPLFETFQYDALNRLRWWCVKDVDVASNECAQAQFGVGYTFTDNGNLTERRTFANGVKENPLERIGFVFPAAGEASAHGVQQRVWHAGTGTGASFKYDAAGRQWQRPGQVVSYNSNDLPEKIVADGSTTTYAYDADGSRYQKKAVFGLHLTRTTTYAGGLYELREESGTAATQPRTHVYYIGAGNTVLAQVTRKEPDLSALTTEFLHNDHLGTVSFTTDAAGTVSNKVRTDPYGNRFDPSQAPRLDTPPPAAIPGITRGYTGHEMEVDDLGVINMKGRIFDPINGRFNSPDPIVQAPQFSQSYNRYMYVMGNPVGATDPTGYNSMSVGGATGDQRYNAYQKRQDDYYSSAAFMNSRANTGAQFDQEQYDYGDPSSDSTDRGDMADKWAKGMQYFRSGGAWGEGAASGTKGTEQAKLEAELKSVGQLIATAGASTSRDQNGIAPASKLTVISRSIAGDSHTFGGNQQPTSGERLTKAGFQKFKTLEAAGASMSKQAFAATRADAGDSSAQREHGGLIVKIGGSYWGAPMVAGQASGGGMPASVNVGHMTKSLVQGVVGAGGGGMLGETTVVGMYHSHPSRPDLSAIDRAVANRFATEDRRGGMPMDFQTSFVWGPRNDFLGGRDPTGRLYSYSP